MSKIFYGIILPDLSRRSTGDTPLTKDAKTEDYQSYMSNLQELLEYIEDKNLPNFFGIDRNLFEHINWEKKDYVNSPIFPLDNTKFFIVYDNLTNGRLNDSMHIFSLYEREDDIFINHYCNKQGNGLGNRNLLVRLEDILIERGYGELRLAGERLWYLETKGGKDNRMYDSIIRSNIVDITNISASNGKMSKHLKFRIISGCTFPLDAKPLDKGDEKHFARKVNQNPSFEGVRELLKEGVSLKQVLSGI